jgi:hypothetical protein
MNKLHLAGIFSLLTTCFFACQSPGSSPTPGASAAAAVDSTLAPNPHGGGGQRVPMNEITPCLQAYQATMGQYGITSDSPSVPITKCPPQTYRITLTEALTYTSFRSWLDSAVNALDPTGKGANVNLQIMPGICTAKFVADMGQPASRTGRISFFIVPVLIDTSSTPTAKPAGSGGGDGYEIGGIQP